ncbi:ribbon-helix-helix domain-containing protein [Staphylococcus agnetis]|uniref:ribbon-helix-helix domain-containing protein n=1 Tax=Staphylococcus agnetis TaxID=985762 RepID=UPI00208EE7BE|nr:ribbon-helix-helix domain-containing protein [Staphylococcus agnetis]MCO4356037.1 ribbon-helix-helix domain-containing protein [Staphylococcus agnetis]MCO4365808.1 ribbon-helix-helix domain-containing protein [Staphylococcus agnetis]
MAYERKTKEVNENKSEQENESHDNKIAQALDRAPSPDNLNINEDLTKKLRKEYIRENKARYQFTLQPSVRKKIDELAKEYKYSSSSEFLNELIKNL